MLSENEVLIKEIAVTERSRLAISVFYVNEKHDFNRFKLTKIKFPKTYGWQADGKVIINNFQLAHLKEFIVLLSSIDFEGAAKSKISLKELDFSSLSAVLKSSQGTKLLKQIASNPELSEDIFALAYKKSALEDFRRLLTEFDNFKPTYIKTHCLKAQSEENIWQYFFEQNPWIFGHGLNYVFLAKVSEKLEAVTTGNSHDKPGKRVDALMRTQAMISQYVLIEIKTPSAPLLKLQPHRAGCWAVSGDLSDAVTHISNTA